MNLKELKEKIDFFFEHSHIDPEKVKVVITTNNPSIGARAGVNLDHVQLGFDWENGQLRLGSNEKIFKKEPEVTNLWWGYLHSRGNIMVKRFFTQADFDEAVESPFVLEAVAPFEASSREEAFKILTEKLKK